MPPVKDEKPAARPLNTSEQIQQIFSEIQSQLPSVNFDNDDQNDDDNEELLESNISQNTDALIESLLNTNDNSFLTLHPKIETPQQPPSVELQMRVSPNLFDNSLQNQESTPKPSVLSMDLFNSIDFDKLPSLAPNHDLPRQSNQTHTFHRPRPTPHQKTSSKQEPNIKNHDDLQILERLAHQANKFYTNERSHATQEHHPFRNLESALFSSSNEHTDRHGKRSKIPESERKTIYLDLRNSNVQKQGKTAHEQHPPIDVIKPISQQIPSSESDSDDDHNDGVLWFEKRQQAKNQQQLNSSK